MTETDQRLSIVARVRLRLREIFDLESEKANEHHTIEMLKEDVDFRGSRVWILIFAILVASLGLNVNSTAVIIGAMLISPLMGPIIGFGLGLGITDLDLIKRSLRNLGVMTVISLLTATLYFLLSPLNQAQSELLARTEPTIYDVLIATVGGAAGILASSMRSKGNVIPGVAIATALMPPLCTAGYGLSQGNMAFFFGALYLYIINSVFIGIATYIMVRVLKFPRKHILDPVREHKIRRWVLAIAVCTIAPSVYFGVLLVSEQVEVDGAHRFVAEQLDVEGNRVVREQLTTTGSKRLEVVLLGQELSSEYIDSIRGLMPKYGLSEYELVVRQGFSRGDAVDVDLLRHTVLSDLYERSDETIRRQAEQIDSLRGVLARYEGMAELQPSVLREAQTLFPQLVSLTLGQTMTEGGTTTYICLYRLEGKLSEQDEERLEQWLSVRLSTPSVVLVRDRRA